MIMEKLPKSVHIIGICGVATSALAIAFHEKGVKVTGSDKGFFPPISTELEKHNVPFYAGWHPEKMIAYGKPNIIVVGTASGSQNPETIYAKENNIPIFSFAEAIGKFFTREKSLICAGTWGKTSSSALLSFILDKAGFDPSYMFGGVSLSHNTSAKLTNNEWSVFEGDEYKSSPTDRTAKFFYYKPTHLLLTAVSWDHADLYPTEKEYFNVFEKLISSIPKDGFIVANTDNKGVVEIISKFKGKIISYGKTSTDCIYENIRQTQNGLNFTIRLIEGRTFDIKSPMIGAFQAENITGCFAMAYNIGISPNIIIEAIEQFQGLKRRLEKRLDGEKTSKGISIFDDIAHSPEKALSVLQNLRDIYKGKIFAIFEPNIGGRSHESIAKYDNAFKGADIVIVPHLTKLKVAENEKDKSIGSDELVKVIKKTHSNVIYIDSDKDLVTFLEAKPQKGDIIVFLGSHGFRGMIEEIIKGVNN
jgi:UDP-N-acetylmuramate: L-alanyl-gamma-D-glutamyl-meso-diaminopimelate ligase